MKEGVNKGIIGRWKRGVNKRLKETEEGTK